MTEKEIREEINNAMQRLITLEEELQTIALTCKSIRRDLQDLKEEFYDNKH